MGEEKEKKFSLAKENEENEGTELIKTDKNKNIFAGQ